MASNGNVHEHFEWGYGKDNGPEHWHKLSQCHRIRKPLWGQSPINIATKDCVDDFHYYEADAQYDFRPRTAQSITNTGRTWQIDYQPPAINDSHDWSYCDGTLRCTYSLNNIHMHWGTKDSHGSEHFIDGQDFAAEVHFVYFNQDYYDSYEEAMSQEGGLMIQAMLFELGDPDPGIQKIIDRLPQIPFKGDSLKLAEFDPFDLMPQKTKEDMYSIYHYYGSMCQPPCNESVTWIIFKRRRTISKQQLEELRKLHSHEKAKKGKDEQITDNRRVKSLKEIFPLNVSNARIDFEPEERENEYQLPAHWEGTNVREVVSAEAEKPWIGNKDMYCGCYSDDQTVTIKVKELLKPRRSDCSHFNCQFKDEK